MLTLEQLREKREALIALADRYKAENVRVFGSVARGEENENSDVDILVHFRPGASLFDLMDLMDLKEDTEELLGLEVDIVSDRGLSPLLASRILGEARPL
jgi:predicted nucleotidyltransferase